MSAVNYAEVAIVHARRGKSYADLQSTVHALGITVVSFDEDVAEYLAPLKGKTKQWGLSLADCACLCLAKQLEAVALTADTAWLNVKDDFNVEVIRQVDVNPTTKEQTTT